MEITKILYRILNVSQYVIEKAWEFLSFTNFTSKDDANTIAGAGLFNILHKFIWIPILLALAVLCVNLIRSKNGEGKEDLKRFSHNMITLFVVVTLLPIVFANVNSMILNSKDKTLTVNSEECAGKIFYRHTTDYKYMYSLIKNLDKEISDNKDSNDKHKIDKINKKYKSLLSALIKKDSQGNFLILGAGVDKKNGGRYTKNQLLNELTNKKKQKAYKYIDIENFDINQVLTKDLILAPDNSEFLDYKGLFLTSSLNGPESLYNLSLSESINEVDNYRKLIEQAAKDQKEAMNYPTSITKVNRFLGINEEHFRYRADFLCIWIEMIANIFLYLSATYALLKIMWEILYNRIFIETLSALDLNNGEKVKRALNGLLGLYISIMFVAFTLILYNNACTFLQTNLKVSGMGYSILVLMLASIALDGPNIIAKYFGIETGMRAGGSFVKGAYNAGRRAAHEAILFKRLSGHKGSSGYGTKGEPATIDKMLHPIKTGKMATRGAVNDALNSGMGKLNDFLNREKPLLPKQNSAQDYLNAMSHDKKKRFNGLDKDQKSNLANRLMANDDKDNIYHKALFNQANSGKNNIDTLKGIINDSDKYIKDGKGNYAETLANNLNEGGAYTDAKSDILNSISKQSKNFVATGEAKSTIEGYKMAAERVADNIPNSNYNGQTVDKVAHMSFAQANADVIRREARMYKSTSPTKISDEEAIQHVILHNTNGCAPEINKKYVQSMSDTIGTLNPISDTRNKGAESFKK